jgi:RNA polymerase sigma factor (sigma-70 family)
MEVIARDGSAAASTVRQAAAGDTVAFARIVAAFHADMVRVAYVVAGGSQDVADDAVQSAWSIAWSKLGSLHDPDRLKSWLVAVAANEARQLCRRQRRRSIGQIHIDANELPIADPTEPDPADLVDAFCLEQAMHALSTDERTLLALRYEAGLDSHEIGRIIGRPSATVRWRLARLVAQLRKELTDD